MVQIESVKKDFLPKIAIPQINPIVNNEILSTFLSNNSIDGDLLVDLLRISLSSSTRQLNSPNHSSYSPLDTSISPQIIDIVNYLTKLRKNLDNPYRVIPTLTSFLNNELSEMKEEDDVFANLSGVISSSKDNEWNTLHTMRRQRSAVKLKRKINELKEVTESICKIKFPGENRDLLFVTFSSWEYQRDRHLFLTKLFISEILSCIQSQEELIDEIIEDLKQEIDQEVSNHLFMIESMFKSLKNSIVEDKVEKYLNLCGIPEDEFVNVILQLANVEEKINFAQQLLSSHNLN